LEDSQRFFGGFVVALATCDLPIDIMAGSVNIETYDKSLPFEGLNLPSIDCVGGLHFFAVQMTDSAHCEFHVFSLKEKSQRQLGRLPKQL
jgi:hypothetical protein